MNNTLSVSGIKNGTVIDHIPSGQALRLIFLLALQHTPNQVTIGIHLPSKSMGSKDLIKIEKRILTENEANEIVVFAPSATINVIQDFAVIDKIKTRLPHTMKNVFVCLNPACISNLENNIDTDFSIMAQGKKIKLTCRYCEKEFDRDQIKIKVPHDLYS